MNSEKSQKQLQFFNKYNKLVLNTSSEVKFSKIKSTFLCSEAKKKSKENISKYILLGEHEENNKNQNKKSNNVFTLKVAYHDKTFEKNIKFLSSYNEFYSILIPQNDISHIPLIKEPLISLHFDEMIANK